MKSFLQQMSSKIKGALSGLDRVRFRGTIRWLSSLRGMGSYLGTMKILLKNFEEWGKASQRLTEETAWWFATAVSESICESAPPTLGTRRVFLVDGTTLTTAATNPLRAEYPPSPNQYGDSAWPAALLVVTHELETGCAMLPEVGAKFGPNAVSEVELARACFQRLPASSIVLADAGFGIFSVAWAATGCGHSYLLRLTAQRFKALLGKSDKVATGELD